MKYEVMSASDIERVVPLYVDYYNNVEGCMWTHETAYKRIHQVVSTEDAISLILTSDSGCVIGFVMGYLQQFDDLVAYCLSEIVIATEFQHNGYGLMLMREIENLVQKAGASMVQLEAVADEMHEKFYCEKLNYQKAKNFILMSKFFK